MSDFDYRPQPGVLSEWSLSVSGYDDPDLNGDLDMLPPRQLVELEIEIRTWEDDYADDTGANLTRVQGGSGWRQFDWDNGAVHRFEWSHVLIDRRCPRCKRPEVAELYMVTDKVWASSGFDRHECWRCLEEIIGRRLEPADFKQDMPANTDLTRHTDDLRARIGLT